MPRLSPQKVIDIVNGDFTTSNAYIEKQVVRLRRAYYAETVYGWGGPRLETLSVQTGIRRCIERIMKGVVVPRHGYYDTMFRLFPIEMAIINESGETTEQIASVEADNAVLDVLAAYFLDTTWPAEGEVDMTAWLKALRRAHDYMTMEVVEGDTPGINYFARNPQRLGEWMDPLGTSKDK
jgi:hypothetical protein